MIPNLGIIGIICKPKVDICPAGGHIRLVRVATHKTEHRGPIDENGREWMGRHGKGIEREWREVTIELPKLPQNHWERRTRNPETKYSYPTLDLPDPKCPKRLEMVQDGPK